MADPVGADRAARHTRAEQQLAAQQAATARPQEEDPMADVTLVKNKRCPLCENPLKETKAGLACVGCHWTEDHALDPLTGDDVAQPPAPTAPPGSVIPPPQPVSVVLTEKQRQAALAQRDVQTREGHLSSASETPEQFVERMALTEAEVPLAAPVEARQDAVDKYVKGLKPPKDD